MGFEINSYDWVSPVFGGSLDDKNVFSPREIFGTAFSIGAGNFLTCAHTLSSASSVGMMAAGFTESGTSLGFAKIIDHEIFPDLDIGIFTLDVESKIAPLPWTADSLAMLRDVSTVGYPYGFEKENATVVSRAFKGYIMSQGVHHLLSGKPLNYELSFMCPRGLSGAPLLRTQPQLQVVGMIVGNRKTDMIVHSYREVETNPERETISITTESLHRGIALQSPTLLAASSRILNKTIGLHLQELKLI